MDTKSFRGMSYRRCGGRGLWLSEIGLGLWKWGEPAYDGSRVDDRAGHRILDRARELGVTHWDTASSYNMGSGNSERLLGRYFRARDAKARDQVVLATKIRNPVRHRHEPAREFSPNEMGSNRKYILRAVDECLERLGTDRIDILYHHAPDLDPSGGWMTPLEETWRAFEDLVRSGKVLYPAVSNRSAAQLAEEQEALSSVSAPAGTRIIAVQNRYSLLDRAMLDPSGGEDAFFTALRRQGVGLVPYFPLAAGFLTGRYRRDSVDAAGRLSQPEDRETRERYLTDRGFALIDGLSQLAGRKGCTIAQIALAWLLSKKEVASVIAGVTRIEQLEENAGSADVRLTGEELGELERVTADGSR